MKTILLEKIGSTNDYVKAIKNPEEDLLVIAKRQTGGRGTKGRSFVSEEGGVYLSLLRLYPCRAEDSFSIMMGSALAVVKTLRVYGVEAKIKWPNDIIVNGKKICGILIENVFEGELVKRAVIGIGVNVNNPISKEIWEIAVSLKEVINKEVDIKTFIATLAFNLYLEADYNEYKRHLLFLGEEVTVITNKSTYKAIIDTVMPNGSLKLRNGEELFAGEVSIR